MKIYILTVGDRWESSKITGVFKNKEKALTFAKNARDVYSKSPLGKGDKLDEWSGKDFHTFECGDELFVVYEEELVE